MSKQARVYNTGYHGHDLFAIMWLNPGIYKQTNKPYIQYKYKAKLNIQYLSRNNPEWAGQQFTLTSYSKHLLYFITLAHWTLRKILR